MKQLKFPPTKPPCFQSNEQWEEYKDLAQDSSHSNTRESFNYCTDCTPQYQAKMKAQGKCRHPATSFITMHGALVGRRDVPTITYGDRSLTISEWAIALNMNERTLRDRFTTGWTVEQALSTPTNVKRPE
jgi:tRNA A37 threonylcarbamoyladenosine dehydratase